uniref:Trm112p-like protein n=1 Tax=Myoviridae sp. ctuIn11 TaxID=2827715 RepID=A0A8S5SHN9_9CAUD|nr:MAG TPA: Trm112p-like protein [Myoviridae sp. ctuIn11]
MTSKEAKRILHPDTTLEALAEIEFLGGFKGKEKSQDAVDEACLMACEALDKQIPQRPINLSNATLDAYCAIFRCPRCEGRLKMKSKGAYCDKCGQAIDWEG